MPTVRYTPDGGSYKHRDGFYADPDDPEHDVDEELADYLLDHYPDQFELVVGETESGGAVTVIDEDVDETRGDSSAHEGGSPQDAESGDSGEGSADATDGLDGDDDADVCTAELSAGGTCGRDLPCPYHTED